MKKKTFKDYFDKIYCINYIEAKKRRECIIDQLTKLDLLDGVEFSYGMPFGKIRTFKKHFIEMAADNNEFGFSTLYNVAGSLNHYTAIKTAYELGDNSVLIFEDDASFLKDRSTIIKYLDMIPNDWDYLYFSPSSIINDTIFEDITLCGKSSEMWIDMKLLKTGYYHGDEYISVNGLNTNGYASSIAYALNRRGMELYINIFENQRHVRNSDGLEYFYTNLSQSPLKSYIPNIALFTQMSQVGIISSVNGDIINYNVNNIGIYTDNGNIYGMVPLHTNVTYDNFFYYKEQDNSIIFNRGYDEKQIKEP